MSQIQLFPLASVTSGVPLFAFIWYFFFIKDFKLSHTEAAKESFKRCHACVLHLEAAWIQEMEFSYQWLFLVAEVFS